MQLEQDALHVYAAAAHNGDSVAAKRDLDRRLDELISFSRASVWREQAEVERHWQNANVVSAYEERVSPLERPAGRVLILAVALVLFAVLLGVPMSAQRNQQNCLAMLVLLSLLWCTEVVPLFVTSMLVPVLTVLLDILPDKHHPDQPMAAPEAAQRVFEVRRLLAIATLADAQFCLPLLLSPPVAVQTTHSVIACGACQKAAVTVECSVCPHDCQCR